MKQELGHEAMRSAPPVAVAGSAWLFGLTLNDWVAVATLGYLALQTGYLLFKWYRDFKKGRK
jgi:hypothetical protein